MTWHLKDRELEEKLIAIDSEFVSRLDRVTKYALEFEGKGFLVAGVEDVEVLYKDEILFVLDFSITELEEVEEYNPHAWNTYPEVTPPEGVPMRVESKNFQNSKMEFTRECAIFRNGEWTHPEIGYPMVRKSCRFRPWED